MMFSIYILLNYKKMIQNIKKIFKEIINEIFKICFAIYSETAFEILEFSIGFEFYAP